MRNYNYTGNLHPFAAVICHSADLEGIRPILDEIVKSGIRLNVLEENSSNGETVLKKACAVLCVLSGKFYESTRMRDILLKSDELNKELIPMRLEEAGMPELISRMIYATNSINLQKYTPAEAAARILEAPVLKNPQRTKAQTRFIRVVGALVLAAVLVIGVVSAVSLFTKKETVEDAAPDLSVLARYGLTEEDLAEIRSVVFTGDKLEESRTLSSVWDYLIETEDGWVRMEDGSFVEMGGPEDFSFLQMLPNLQTLVLVNQTASGFPDLSMLEKLNTIEIWNCNFENLEGLRNCQKLYSIHITSDTVADLSPLTDCPYLTIVHVTGCGNVTSLDGFCPPALLALQLHLDNLENLSGLKACDSLQKLDLCSRHLNDLSPLSNCRKLTEVNIHTFDSPVTDFSPLANDSSMQNLRLRSNQTLDIGFMSNLTSLKELYLDCPNIRGTEALSACANLNRFELRFTGEPRWISLDCLRGLNSLQNIRLDNVSTNFDFLEDVVTPNTPFISLDVSGPITDWSGLRFVPRFSRLNVDPWENNVDQLLDTIRDTPITELQLFGCKNLKVEDIPAQVDKLQIDRSYITSLEGLPCTNLTQLVLGKCWSLRSLAGVEQLEKLKELHVYDTLLLTDWSAIYGMELHRLVLTRQYVLPDFEQVCLSDNGVIAIHDPFEMTDVSCLDALPDTIAQNSSISVDVISREPVNLNALYRFQGHRLTVSPMLEEQAADLVDQGCFEYYEIEYPDENWNMEEMEFQISSLEDLDMLPKALLKYVTELNIADDTVYSMDYNPEIWGEEGGPQLRLRNWDTDEIIPVRGTGSQIDFDKLSQLTGLRALRLCGQKMDSLNGIQNLENLRELTIIGCDIPDYSALFAVDSIEFLRLGGSNITSIQGIQNLGNLMQLDLQTANVTDLTPLAQMNFCPRACEEGFSLCLPHTWMVEEYPDDLSALAAVPKYDELNLNGYADTEWVSYLAGKEIGAGHFLSMFNRHDGQEKLEQLVDTVGSIGLLKLSWNEGIIDLTCLTKLEGLQRVDISTNMERAIRSLDGTDYQFELRIEG